MAYREYIGSRYVPILGRKDETLIEWDNTKPYEPLTIVLYQGASYTSRQYVPVGIPITNEEFWALTGNYNAQVEAYRQEVRSFDGRITANNNAIETEAQAREAADATLTNDLAAETTARGAADATLTNNLAAETAAREAADATLTNNLAAETAAREAADAIFASDIATITDDGWVTNPRIDDGAVSMDKFAQDVLDEFERLRPKGLEYRRIVYVDGDTGNDDNDGSIESPYKTFMRALRERENGYDDLYIHLVTPGTYMVTDFYITNQTCHVIGDVANCILYWNHSLSPFSDTTVATFYNCYFHFENVTINCPTGFHLDACSVYANNSVTIETDSKIFDSSLGTIQLVGTKLLNTGFRGRTSVCFLQNMKVDYATPVNAIFYFQASHAYLTGSVAFNGLSANSELYFIDLQASYVACDWDFSSLNISAKFKYALRCRFSYINLSGTAYNNAKTYSTEGYVYCQRSLVMTTYVGNLITASGIEALNNQA